MVILTKTQEKTLLNLAPARSKLLIHTLLQSGVTSEEICTLKVSDVHTTSICIHNRELPIPQQLAQQLKQAQGEYVFSTRQSPQITPRRVQQLVKEALKTIEVTATPQILRYTYVHNEFRKNTDVQTIAQRLGVAEKRIYEILGEQAHKHTTQETTPQTTTELLAELITQTGCSIQEIPQIRKTDLTETTIRIGEKTIPLTDSFAQTLREHAKKHNSNYLFASRQSPNITVRRIQQLFKQAGISATQKRYEAIAHKTVDEALQHTGLSRQRIIAIKGRYEVKQ